MLHNYSFYVILFITSLVRGHFAFYYSIGVLVSFIFIIASTRSIFLFEELSFFFVFCFDCLWHISSFICQPEANIFSRKLFLLLHHQLEVFLSLRTMYFFLCILFQLPEAFIFSRSSTRAQFIFEEICINVLFILCRDYFSF